MMEEERIVARLIELLRVPESSLSLEQVPDGLQSPVDCLVRASRHVFVCEVKRTNTTAAVFAAARQLCAYAERHGDGIIPLLVVPYMGDAGSAVCEELDVNWIDLSGNARILAPGLNISWLGRPNRFKYETTIKGVFAPKIARIVRWFLIHPKASLSQRELARVTELDEGYVSHAVRQLLEAGYLTRDAERHLRILHPAHLLDDWRQAYDFSKHRILRGHVLARSGEGLTRKLAETFEKRGKGYAFTGLSAAWLIDKFAGYRLNTVYLEKEPNEAMLDALAFRQEPRGANVWFIVPKDEGVFEGATTQDGIRCVHPVQTYVDLKALPERAEEAAESLRESILKAFPRA